MLKSTVIQSDLELARSIAQKMRDPQFVKEVVSDPKNQNPDPLLKSSRWHPLSIAGGYPGVLPLFTELDSIFPEDRWDLVAHEYILQIVRAVETTGITSITMFGGIAGVCLYLRQASKNEQRYKKVLTHLDGYLIKHLRASHLSPLMEQLQQAIPRRPALYESIQGLSSIGIYALVNYEKPEFKELAHEIIQQFVLLAEPIHIKGRGVPGWYVAPEFFFLESDRKIFPDGNFNLGLSHGIPGVLAFLSIAMMQGIECKGQQKAITVIADWVQAKRKTVGNRYFWDSVISFEEETSGQPTDRGKSRDAWCYGTPGVARALYLAGRATKNKAMQEFALEAFRSIFQSSREDWNLPGPNICHGIAGLLLITNLMARDTGCDQLKLETEKLREILLSHHDASSHFGFKNAELLKHQKGSYVWIECADLLEGVSGVLLTLLSLHTNHYSWHLPFLIDNITPTHSPAT